METNNSLTNKQSSLVAESAQYTYTQTRIQTPENKQLVENRIITGIKPGKWLESYKMLRTRCLHFMDAMNWSTLAITSPTEGSGNTLTAVNLSISIAMELSRSVLLVDANFQNPSVCKLLGLKTEMGLSDYLINDIPLNELLVNPDIDRLVILPSGNDVFNSTELLRSPKMLNLVTELKNRYPSRIIIFDLPALLTQADTLGFAPHVDCLLLVTSEGFTKIDDLKQAAELLKDINILGTVLNKATDNKIKFENN
ncbi:MAG: CpsD/CapB family tyrosine-protein kinase [Methylococcaceae bacterium]|jgi:capsular exopolysaccharide synthesis family protein